VREMPRQAHELANPPAKNPGIQRRHLAWCTVGLLALACGFALPQIVMSLNSESSATSSLEEKDAANSIDARTAPQEKRRPEVAIRDRLILPAIARSTPERSEFDWFRVIGGAAIGIVACICFVWLAKRWLARRAAAGENETEFETLESLNLGNRCIMHLVKVGNARLLAGVDRTGLKAVVALRGEFDHTLAQVTEEAAAFKEKQAA
jgi:flagellar biogenesis protein FliO